MTGATARVRFTVARRRRPQRRRRAAARAGRAPASASSTLPSTWLDEVHGADVVTVAAPGEHDGATADAAVTADAGRRPRHLGGRLRAGRPRQPPRASSAPPTPAGAASPPACCRPPWRPCGRSARSAIEAHVGPCVHAECYEFGAGDLAALEARFGAGGAEPHGVGQRRPSTSAPSIAASLAEVGVARGRHAGRARRATAEYWSHRARGEPRAPGHGRVAGGQRVIGAVDAWPSAWRRCRERIAAAGGRDVTHRGRHQGLRRRRHRCRRRTPGSPTSARTTRRSCSPSSPTEELAVGRPRRPLHRPAAVEQGEAAWPASSTCGRRSTGRRSAPCVAKHQPRRAGCSSR